MSCVSGAAGSLWEMLALVPDHRRPEGKRYPLASLLLIAVAALLSGRRDQLGIVRWGKRLSREALAGIGIDRGRVPAPSVWCELFQDLDIISLERILGGWVQGGQAAGHVAEDQARTNAGHAPQALAALRNTALTIIRRLGFKPVEGFEHFAEHRKDAIDALTQPRTE